MSDETLHALVDANITITGTQIQEASTASVLCVMIWGSLIILPLFLLCFDPWKRCTYPAFDIHVRTYQALARLLHGASLRNVTLNVTDNCFNDQKAALLCQALQESRIAGLTFINGAGEYDFNDNEYSHFKGNMLPIKMNHNIISDIRWGT